MTDASRGPKLGDDRIAMAVGAQRGGSPVRPKRFFKSADVGRRGDAYAVLLDGRPAKTPARLDLAVPTEAAAAALAEEWNGLGDTIDPAALPLTRIVNAAIDGVAAQSEAVFEEIVNYVGSDLLLYRAETPERLVADQASAWDPVLDVYRTEYGARFILARGVMPVSQPPATLSLMRQALAEAVGQGPGAPFRLAALNVMTTLTGSALLGLAVMNGRLTPAEAWAAAHVDETFQESQWGQDAEARARRDGRWREMAAAARLGQAVDPA